jgi:hypothetical protein
MIDNFFHNQFDIAAYCLLYKTGGDVNLRSWVRAQAQKIQKIQKNQKITLRRGFTFYLSKVDLFKF